MGNLYDKNGYLNIGEIVKGREPFIFCVGGRGTGKTYGALKYVLDNNIRFLYMRRTQAQADIITKPEFSPFKAVCSDTDYNIICKPVTKYNSGFYAGIVGEDGVTRPDGEPLGYSVALSTVSNLRGFDMSDITMLIYDEFIAERHERPLKDEAGALFNCYETINRNRELKGREPLKLLCLANANNLSNPIFSELGLIDKVVSMAERGQEKSIMPGRGIAIYLLHDSPVSAAKSTTALYTAVGDGDFKNMAVGNAFSENLTKKQKINLKEYTPYMTVDGLTIYKHKSKNLYYISQFNSGVCKDYTTKAFMLLYRKLFTACDASGLILYDNPTVQLKFENILN